MTKGERSHHSECLNGRLSTDKMILVFHNCFVCSVIHVSVLNPFICVKSIKSKVKCQSDTKAEKAHTGSTNCANYASLIKIFEVHCPFKSNFMDFGEEAL